MLEFINANFSPSMVAFISAFLFVVLAEMGDKTQLLAIAFAAKYPWKTVMLAITAATAANHLFAVVVGDFITNYVSMDWIQIAASISFIIFGLWTIRGDTISEEDQKARYKSAFWTVAMAFFIAEMGDKTQLATITLAAQFHTVLPVWCGTLLGMIIADGFGIIVGTVLGKRIPEKTIKWVAAIVFILCGVWGLWDCLG